MKLPPCSVLVVPTGRGSDNPETPGQAGGHQEVQRVGVGDRSGSDWQTQGIWESDHQVWRQGGWEASVP